jgi:adenylate cyclase
LPEERVQRRLAAILAADVVGYSAMMQRAEEATYAEFERLKRELIAPSLCRHEGRLIKTTGDGALIGTREGVAEAIRLARRALELDPRFGIAAAVAGLCHLDNILYGYGIDPQFERREAVRLLRLALSVDDDDPDTLATAAMISAYIVGDCERALEMADRAVALNPNSFGAWNSRGWVYRVAGLPEEAIRSFERAIRMSPVDPELHLTFAGMGMAFIELGRLTRPSLQERKRNVRTPPVSPAYRCLAAAFALLGRDAEAREAAAHVLELDPAFTISALIARGGYSNAKGLD